ncbi:MAG: pitrilysin family protein [Bdellovibrionales bacterium]
MVVFDYTPEFNKTKLENGVTVVTEHHRYTRATCASVFVKMGTRHEPDHLNGVAHFLEHLVFKGTQSRSALEILKTLEAVGGDLNAYTTREYTCFHSTSLREHLNLSMDVLTDITNNAVIDPIEFDKERDVVLQEIDMTADQLEEYIFDLCFEEAYAGHSLGRSILGTPEVLNAMTPDLVKDYYNKYYRGENIIVAVAGDVVHDEVVKVCSEQLGIKVLEHQAPNGAEKAQVKPFRKFVSRPSEQVHLLMNFPSSSYSSNNRFDAYMVNAILGGGMTSRLYQKIREDKGWVYSVYSYLSSFTDTGTLSLYAGTTNEYALQVMQEFKNEVNRIVEEGVSQIELDYFKRQVKGQILLGADDIENRMTSIAVNEMVFGEYRSVQNVIEEIEAVTPQGVEEYLKSMLNWKDAGILVLGNCDVPTADSILSIV